MSNKTFKSDFVSLYDASLEPLSKAQELELAKQASLGNAHARETLIRANRYIMNEIVSSCNKSGYIQRQSEESRPCLSLDDSTGSVRHTKRGNPSPKQSVCSYCSDGLPVQ